MLQDLLNGGENLVRRPPGQYHRAPGDPQADTERRLFRAAAADVADHRMDPAVRRLHEVIEIPAKQHLPAAGPVARRDRQPRIGQQR